jgi:2,3-bisphosphoglycerate-dependent phosphoglycerate mutase
MRHIYVVTHAEATHHVDNIVGGWHDSELTPGGECAAAAVAARLREMIPARSHVELYSSDLKRAQQTAAPMSELLHARPVLDRRLREKSYGVAEGRPQAWLDQRFVPPPASGDRMNHDEGVTGAETKAVFARRIYAALDGILQSPCEHQVIVTHGFAATFLVAAWIKMPIDSLSYVHLGINSGSITTLKEDDYSHNRQVISLGDTSHLDRASTPTSA